MDLRDLLWEADLLGLERLTWTRGSKGWRCTSPSLRSPRLAPGKTPADALYELVRFAWRVL
jgi:hypothetical protein